MSLLILEHKTPHPFQDCGVLYDRESFILNLTHGSVRTWKRPDPFYDIRYVTNSVEKENVL